MLINKAFAMAPFLPLPGTHRRFFPPSVPGKSTFCTARSLRKSLVDPASQLLPILIALCGIVTLTCDMRIWLSYNVTDPCLTFLISGCVWSSAIAALWRGSWWAASSVMFPGAVSTPYRFSARPRQMTMALASVASLLLDLICFNVPNILLAKDHSIVDDPFRRTAAVEPDT